MNGVPPYRRDSWLRLDAAGEGPRLHRQLAPVTSWAAGLARIPRPGRSPQVAPFSPVGFHSSAGGEQLGIVLLDVLPDAAPAEE